MRAAAAIAIAAAAAALVACSAKSEPPSATLHTLRLPPENVSLPDAPGRATVTTDCSVCHTTRYVLDQPRFPRKKWQAIVDKMRKTYGAPVADSDVGAIVDYVVAVRGNGS